ncbi:hypothetical protein FisN_4Lu594 [Fistulifera solaris]|uniref:Uncharacterized protein n=1 Tax=Fistulifera solaris TaxID=1519565 RepID=A0A1Z5KDG9_FISSO|nr:hypothetical protein FisN_4Lu594 [Fistulifera solaris]|eukprot:GAX24267.1 hypothetical protein FisN_4Lu594 [Fistulifera solaris]
MGSTSYKKNAAANPDDEATARKRLADGEDLGEFRHSNSDDLGNYTSASSIPMGHSSSRQSTRHPSASSRNRTGASDPTLRDNFPTLMPSCLMDSASRNHNSILEKSRKMAAQNKRQRTTRKISEGRSNRTLFTIGRRPSHWDQRDLAASNKRPTRSLDMNSKRSRAAVLSTFTQHSISEGRLSSTRKHLSTPARQPDQNVAAIQCQDPIVDDLEQETPREFSRNSFAASFMSLPSNSAPISDKMTASPHLSSPQLQSSMGTRKKSKALFSGRLCKRLQSIRDTIRGDKIRFQSGQYPFSVVSLDMNDPRNRATSLLDVTLVETSGTNYLESQKVVMLGFVHHATGRLSHLISHFAWICFACDTARELLLEKGKQLRIYNSLSMELSGSFCGFSSSTLPAVKTMILATTLCELYPQELPQLPDAPNILQE